MTDLVYPDALIARILRSVNVIAMVGASTNWNRPSYFVMKYLQGKGYRVIPVNPGAAGQDLLGETVRASLSRDRRAGGHGGYFPPLRGRRRRSWTRPSPSAPKWSGCSSACATTRRRPRRRPPG